MATLRYSQIRAHPDGTINYIANKDKIISTKVHDVHNVLNYMGEPESTERVYSFARHCSCNPALAAQQMELYRARYYESNSRIAKDGELLGLHFFLSYTEDDDPNEETMNDIVTKLAEHPLLCDHAIFGANHFDKAHKHTHFYVSNFSAEGRPSKLCLRRNDYNALRKYSNQLCVEHGLSIIDLETLRYKDPEYSAWIDGVIASGKIKVHPERKEHKGAKHQNASTRQIYYKWLKNTEEFNILQEQLLTKAQLRRKKADETYLWSLGPRKLYPVTDKNGKYYAVPKRNKDGQERPFPELFVTLTNIIYTSEIGSPTDTDDWKFEDHIIYAQKDYKVQAIIDQIATARELNVECVNDISKRIVTVGKQMNDLKRENARHESSIKMQEEIIEAWRIYDRLKGTIGTIDDPETQEKFKNSYAILAKHQVFSFDEFLVISRRLDFERRKIDDYEKKMPILKRQYRDLKRLDAMNRRIEWNYFEKYDQSQPFEQGSTGQEKNSSTDDASREINDLSLDNQIKNAEQRKSDIKKDHRTEMQSLTIRDSIGLRV